MARAGLVPLLVAGIVVAGCSGAGNPPPHIVIPDTTVAPSPVAQPGSVIEPSQIVIDKIGVDAALHPTGLDSKGVIVVPDLDHVDEVDYLCAQHYLDGDKPTCKTGAVPGALAPAIVVAHVDGRGKAGAFARLKNLGKGDEIQIRRVDGSTLNFRVTSTETVQKNSFPTAKVYGNVTKPSLRLLTCGGVFVGAPLFYRDQVIVYAEEV